MARMPLDREILSCTGRGQRARPTRTQRVQRSRVMAGQGIDELMVGGVGGGGFQHLDDSDDFG